MQILQQSNAQAFLYGFSHLFDGDIEQLTEPNLSVFKKNAFEKFYEKSERLRIDLDKQYKKQLRQIGQFDK